MVDIVSIRVEHHHVVLVLSRLICVTTFVWLRLCLDLRLNDDLRALGGRRNGRADLMVDLDRHFDSVRHAVGVALWRCRSVGAVRGACVWLMAVVALAVVVLMVLVLSKWTTVDWLIACFVVRILAWRCCCVWHWHEDWLDGGLYRMRVSGLRLAVTHEHHLCWALGLLFVRQVQHENDRMHLLTFGLLIREQRSA